MAMRLPRVRFTVRRLMLVVAVLATLALLGLVLPALDAASHGPYSTWYNRRCQKIANEAGLVGRPERDVIRVLGAPTYTYGTRTYNYAPCPWAPTAKFQVHCEGGFVTGVEQFDD
jgi:hypothetical protein